MKILLAEDDKIQRMIIGSALEKEGHEVVTQEDGEEALKMAIAHDFDVIITDIMMPGKEGIELISELLEVKPDAKIIAISAEGNVGHSSFLQMALAMGAKAILKKPFTARELLDVVASVREA